MLQDAIALHRQGRLAEAEAAYRAILAREPDNTEVGNKLGLLAMDAEMPQQAAAVFEQVCALAPDNAAYLVNLGAAWVASGRAADALPVLQRAATLKPDMPDAHFQQGQALSQLRRLDEALEAFSRAAALRPDAKVWTNRGATLGDLGRFQEALDDFAKALAADPENPVTNSNYGFALTQVNRHEEAVASFRKAVTLEPNDAGLHYNLADPLKYLGRLDEALASYDRAIALAPDMTNAHINRGLVLTYIGGRSDDALTAFDRAIALEPDSVAARIGRSGALVSGDRLEEALAYNTELAATPRFRPEADFHSAMLLMRHGRWEDGWRLYEARRTLERYTDARHYPQPEWTGAEPLAGKTLYVHGEQGLGDQIMFARYLRLARQAGATVIFSPKDNVRRLFTGQDLADEVRAFQDAPPAFDYHIPLASLPRAFGTRADAVPAEIPYLHAEAPLVETWRARIGDKGFRIGVCWAGSADPLQGPDRSFPLAALAPLAALPGVRLISLQKKDGLAELDELPLGMTVETLGADFDAGADALVDTAAVMASLDLVITCDTSVAHLAGAMARPVWTALKRHPEWRWMLKDEASPWYPGMVLFRQPEIGDWNSVFAAMQARLAKELGKA